MIVVPFARLVRGAEGEPAGRATTNCEDTAVVSAAVAWEVSELRTPQRKLTQSGEMRVQMSEGWGQ